MSSFFSLGSSSLVSRATRFVASWLASVPPWHSCARTFLPARNPSCKVSLLLFAGNPDHLCLVSAVPDERIVSALSVIFDVRNHPILIHCNKGKVRPFLQRVRVWASADGPCPAQHRTGCLVGCLRKAQQWSHAAIFDEYRRYSAPKSRSIDQQYIEAFDGVRRLSLLLAPFTTDKACCLSCSCQRYDRETKAEFSEA